MIDLLLVVCICWLVCSCRAVQAAQWQPLADTGQTRCYDPDGNELDPCPQWNEQYYGQDGNYRSSVLKPDPSFTDNQDGTVTDNNSGLIWTKGPLDRDSDSHPDETYQDQADRECKFLGEEWRLPTRFELLSIVDFSTENQFSIFSDPLPSTNQALCFWTTTEDDNGKFFCLNPTHAEIYSLLPDNKMYVRCVTGTFLHEHGPYKSTATYPSSGGQHLTILDVATGLSWFGWHADIDDDGNSDSSDKATWAEGLAYCKNVTYQGHSDWRLPDIRELESLVTPEFIMPPVFQGERAGYWSSTTDTWQTSSQNRALVIDFSDGLQFSKEKNSSSEKYFVRCVRNGVFDINMVIDGTGFGKVVSSDGKIDCGSSCSATYMANDRVSLSAAPAPHSHFTGWSGGCNSPCGNGSPCSFDVFRDMNCAATFDLDRHTLTLNTAGSGLGTVSGGGTYDYGTLTTISATPAAGSIFESWSGDCSGTSDTMLVSVDKDYTCTAHFSLNSITPSGKYTLTVNTAGTGSGTVSGGGIYDYGTLTTISAIPAAGSAFERWSGDCASTSASVYVYMDNDYTCTAMFRRLSTNKFPWTMFLPAIITNKHH